MSLTETIITKSISVFRGSRPEVPCQKGILRNFATFTGKHLCQRLFFNKVAGLRLFYRTPPVAASVLCTIRKKSKYSCISQNMRY